MSVRTFNSTEEMFDSIREGERRADEAVQPWQDAVKIGDYFVRVEELYGDRFVIFGEVIDFEYEEDREVYQQEHMKNHRLTKCYSVLCPEGEFGDVHVVSIGAVITKEMFEEARDADWGSAVIHDWLSRGWRPPGE